MHYYQFNIADYRKDTTHLSPVEHFIYRSLIDWYYLDEQPIPKITQTVMRRLGVGYEQEQNLQNVLSDFFVLGDDGYRHGRIDKEILEYHKKAITNKTNGKLGGRPTKTTSVNFANRTLTERKPNAKATNNQELETINQEPRTKSQKQLIEEELSTPEDPWDDETF